MLVRHWFSHGIAIIYDGIIDRNKLIEKANAESDDEGGPEFDVGNVEEADVGDEGEQELPLRYSEADESDRCLG